LAKYSFHIDVVSQQVKTFPRHFFIKKSHKSLKERDLKHRGSKEKNQRDLENMKEKFEKYPQKSQPNSEIPQQMLLPNYYNYNPMAFSLGFNFSDLCKQ
jgi:hypothetical protein